MTTSSTVLTRRAVEEHLAAFNGHDTPALLAGFDADIVWSTGEDTVRGRDKLVDVFDDWLWSLTPRLDVVNFVVEGDTAAVEAIEHLVIKEKPIQFPVAIILTVQNGLLSRVKVFREGTADAE